VDAKSGHPERGFSLKVLLRFERNVNFRSVGSTHNFKNTSGQDPLFDHPNRYSERRLVRRSRRKLSMGLRELFGAKEAKNGLESGNHLQAEPGKAGSLFD